MPQHVVSECHSRFATPGFQARLIYIMALDERANVQATMRAPHMVMWMQSRCEDACWRVGLDILLRHCCISADVACCSIEDCYKHYFVRSYTPF